MIGQRIRHHLDYPAQVTQTKCNMMLIVLGGLSANHVRQHEKYLLEDERWLVAEPFVSDDLSSEFSAMRLIAKECAPTEALARGVLSWEDAEAISPRQAIARARETLAETPFANRPGALVVHGPPNEPTRVHVHFPFTLHTDEKIYRRPEARRALWAAAVKVAERHGLTVPHRTGEQYHLRTARAAQVWQTTPTLYSWIMQEVWPQAEDRMRAAQSWANVFGIFAESRLRFVQTPRGGAALLDDSTGKAVRASAISLHLSRSVLERRFGPLPAFAFIEQQERVKRSFAAAGLTADAQEIERHRAARAAWAELYEERITRERAELDAAYGQRCTAIAQTQKVLLHAVRETDFDKDERRGLTRAAATYRSRAVDEALAEHTGAMRALYAKYPKKPSRKLHEWQKDRATTHAPVGRILAFEKRMPQLPKEPWKAVPSPAGGFDLYYDRRRVATDDGQCIGILDADLPASAIERLALPNGYRVEGPAPLRERMREIALAHNHTMSDGGDPQPESAPLHAQLPNDPIARRCLALMDALRIRPILDGLAYRANTEIKPTARRIELDDPCIVVVHGHDVARLATDVQPAIVGENLAIYRCIDADTADMLRDRAVKAGLRVDPHISAHAQLRFTDAPIARLPKPPAHTLDGSLLAPLAEEPTPARTRTRGRGRGIDKKRRR